MKERLLIFEPSWFTLRHGYYGQIDYLNRKGFEVAIASEGDSRGVLAAKELGVAHYEINVTPDPSPRCDFVAVRRLWSIIRKFRPNIIQCSTKKAGFLAGIFGRVLRIPTVYIVRGLIREATSRNKMRIFRLIEKVNIALATKVVVISNSNLRYLLDNRLCQDWKVVQFGSGSLEGVDTDRFSRTAANIDLANTLRRNLGIPESAFVIGFVGRLVLEKGIKELALAWSLLKCRDEDVRLLIVSPDEVGPGAMEWVLRLKGDKRVHFSGFLADPVPAYVAMDCLTLPSYLEGFSSVLLEAASCELPVVATNVPGCLDAIVHGKTGWLVERGNESALASAILEVRGHQDTARVMGKHARANVVEKFQQELIWSGYATLYRSLNSR